MKVASVICAVALLAKETCGAPTFISNCNDLRKLRGDISGSGETTVAFSDNKIKCDTDDGYPQNIRVEGGHSLIFSRDGEKEVTFENVRIIVELSELTVETKTTFKNNKLRESKGFFGGALVIEGSTVIFKEEATFKDIKGAYDGGAIAVIPSLSDNSSSLTFKEDVMFEDILSMSVGGGILAVGSKIYFEGKTYFKDVKTEEAPLSIAGFLAPSGGAVYSFGAKIEFNKDAMFEKCSTQFEGGALYVSEKSEMVFKKNAGFFDNKSQIFGGAITVCGGSSVFFESGAEFEDNIAKGGGGAVDVYSSGAEVVFDGDVFFKDNIAKFVAGLDVSYGGHIFAEERGVVKFKDSSRSYFMKGEADIGGGVAAITRGELILGGKAEFKKNVSRECGGAIAADRRSFKDKSKELKFKKNEDKNDDKSDAGDCDNLCIGSSDDQRAFPQGGKTCE